MASNKETPRQRMIGMMYLVLTALLALQVSSAMIYKFQSLNESLELTTKETGTRNNLKLNAILSEVEKRKRESEKHLAVTAKEVSTKSAEMIEYIENIKKALITESGGYDEDGNLKGAKEETKVEVLMIGANNSGKAYEMKNKLDQYVKFMKDKTGVKFSPLALDGKDDPLFQNNEDQRNKDFAHLNFGQTPLVAGLAILSEIQSRISTMQATTLTNIGDKVAVNDFKVDKMMPMARPSSKVVAAGTKYEAQLFMAATSSSQKPVMFLGENPIEVDPTGVGKFSFTASGGTYDPHGNMRKTWTGKIKVTKPDGTDTLYTITEEYTVTKPVIQVQAAAVQALYKNCGNKLNIQVPALGNAYNPRITAEGANVIAGSNRGFVTVVPTGASVNLKVNSDGNYIGEERFRVKLIPMPTLEFKVNGRKIDDPIRGVDAMAARNVTVKAIPDRDFAEFLPDDAHYQIFEWKLTIARGRTGIRTVPYTTETASLGSVANDLRPGDRLVIEVTQIKRRTFRGDWEIVNMPKSSCIYIVAVN